MTDNAWQYVKEAIDSNWVSTAGPFVDRFERAVGEAVGAPYAVATATGTAALHIALIIGGVEPEDEVIVSALSFIAPANAIRYVGAWPLFVDADPNYGQMDPQCLADTLRDKCAWQKGALRNRRTGRRVRAIMPVHILGHSVDLDPILDLAHQHELVVIEDAAEAFGARYRDRPVGRPTDLACLSFNGNKTVTAGGGGTVVANRPDWAERARYLTTQAKNDADEYVHHEIGFNYRLTNLQAALGLSQVEALDAHVEAKRRIASKYAEQLAGADCLDVIREAPWARSSCWLSAIRLNDRAANLDCRMLNRRLKQRHIETRLLWQPLSRSPAHAAVAPDPCPVADRHAERTLCLPSSVGLDDDEINYVCASIHDQL